MKIDSFYEKNLDKLIEEISLFKNEEDLWITKGSIINPAGTLAFHLTGSLNHFIGKVLANTDYVRERDKEFSEKNIPREKLIEGLKKVKELVKNTLSKLSEEDLKKDYPVKFFDQTLSTSDALIFFLSHLNYHLGQVNYIRRIIS